MWGPAKNTSNNNFGFLGKYSVVGTLVSGEWIADPTSESSSSVRSWFLISDQVLASFWVHITLHWLFCVSIFHCYCYSWYYYLATATILLSIFDPSFLQCVLYHHYSFDMASHLSFPQQTRVSPATSFLRFRIPRDWLKPAWWDPISDRLQGL